MQVAVKPKTQKENERMIQILKHKPHRFSALFPAMDADEKAKLTADIKENGLIEPIVLFEGEVLDGVHRQESCVKAGITPRYIDYNNLPRQQRGESPLRYVFSKNMRRRHLNASQRAAIAAESLPLFEAEAEKRKLGTLKRGGEAPIASKDANGEHEGKSAAQAAKLTGASQAMVERAKALKNDSPDEFKKVKAGKLTLSKTEKAKQKAADAKSKLETAHARIAKICDKSFADAVRAKVRLKNPKDVIQFASLSDADMKRVGGLIGTGGFKLKKAILFNSRKNLTARHLIQDLLNKQASMAGKPLTVDFGPQRVTVELIKNAIS